jgi:hypothetical protein
LFLLKKSFKEKTAIIVKNNMVNTPIVKTIFGLMLYSLDVKIKYIPNITNAKDVNPE